MPTPLPRFHAGTWYRDTVGEPDPRRPLAGTLRCSTAVIGAGLAGLSTALELAERGAEDIVVVDRGDVAEGASGRNGGFVFAGFSLDPHALAAQQGEEAARRMHGWTRDAVETVRRRCREHDVPMHETGIVLADWFADDARLGALQDRLARTLDFELDWIPTERMKEWVVSDRYGAGLLESRAFHFHPLAYARALASRIEQLGGKVHVESPATRISSHDGSWRVETPDGRLDAQRVVLATGGYDRQLLPRAQRCVQPVGTYVAVTEPLGDELGALIPSGAAVYDTRFAFDYYRPLPDGRLLWGGRISTADRDPAAVERLLRRDLTRVFPSLSGVRFSHSWGGWMSYARHQMPVLGEFRPGLWLALAFGGHGMAPTALAGRVLAEAMSGDPERLHAFSSYGPTWAGGPFGRVAVQAVYWWKQLRDRMR